MKPAPGLLDEVSRRIVASVRPLRILVFGSAARDEMNVRSDLDLMVIVPDGSDCRRIAKSLYRQLRGLPYSKDIIVVQNCDVETHGDNPFLVLHTALAEGKELYRATAG